ncbi:ComEC/Rec2 family competence protein [Paenibacillus thermotolerans]|uniref:ComEC/Rec2 family competence protein n=1 Tax=Paenibacillus thermotolerans TaxID=3027807 RepID=UPI0023675216|nr:MULTISPECIES: MBL fold metallo-hydrolase [unclassified Paenibacillus]
MEERVSSGGLSGYIVSMMLFDVNRLETDALGDPHKCPADSFLIRVQGSDGEINILLDGAKKGQGRQIVIPYLLEQGITTLDCVILSHAHSDHFGGLVDLLNDPRFTVRQFVYSPIDDEIVRQSDDGDNYSFWMELRERLRTHPNVLELNENDVGTSLRFGSKLSFDVVSTPDREYLGRHSHVDLNDFNIVLRLRYGRFTALMTGDCGVYQANRILNSPQKEMIRSVTMLKAAHHGGDASTTEEFIRECGAPIVVVPCNETVVEHRPSFIRNMHLFGRLGAKVLRADWSKRIQVNTDGNAVECVLETEWFTEKTFMKL